MRKGLDRTYTDVTLPLRRLTSQNVKFQWTNECKAVLQELKMLLVDSMVMVHWDVKMDTRL